MILKGFKSERHYKIKLKILKIQTHMFLRSALRRNFSTFQKSTMNQPFVGQAMAEKNFAFKQPVAHTMGQKEEVRQEFVQMWNELDEMITKAMPMVRKHYEECGTPKTTRINNFALPEEVI
jgi:hypothetical protein